MSLRIKRRIQIHRFYRELAVFAFAFGVATLTLVLKPRSDGMVRHSTC